MDMCSVGLWVGEVWVCVVRVDVLRVGVVGCSMWMAIGIVWVVQCGWVKCWWVYCWSVKCW